MDQELLDRVLESPRLPSLPMIAIEVIDLVQQRDVNVKQIAATIQHDPALSSKILKTVNSSFYGQAHAVSSISHALVVLGLNAVKTLALGFSLVGNLKHAGGAGFDHFGFWKRSLYTATAAKALSKQVGLMQQEEAFLGGLLQDLGMLAMVQALGDTYYELLDEAGGDHRRLFELERRRLDITHAEVGRALAETWRLPPLLTRPIALHETPEEASEDFAPLIRTVALGNAAADVFMDETGASLEGYLKRCKQWFGLESDVAEPLLGEIHNQTNEMRRLFDLPTGELGDREEILARANEALLRITMEAQQQTTELERQNRQLLARAETDPLTGIANRGKFNAALTDAFAEARDAGEPLAVLFLDADHFKALNDTHGHPTGDRVLVELAEVLTRETPESALPCRYGGEEFAVVLPGVDRCGAARIAEDVRSAIERHRVASDEDEALRVTASIGVAAFERGCFEHVDQLIKAADQGVYAAKAAGRNAVRIFTPRPKPQPQPA